MAFRFCDSFDHYTILTQKWTVVGDSNPSVQSVTKRTGISALQSPIVSGTGTVNTQVVKTLDNQGTWIIGLAFYASALPPNTSTVYVIAHTWDAGTLQGEIILNTDGTLSLCRGSTAVAKSSLALNINTWYYIEFKHVVASSGGLLEARVNGIVWATFTGNTQATSNSSANQIGVGHVGPVTANNAMNTYSDDVYALDGTDGTATQGVPNNTYWGDTRVECKIPTGAGTYQALTTLVGAASQVAAISEIPPDDATSYIGDTVVGNASTFTFPALVASMATIHAVQTSMRAANSDAGGGNFKRRVHISGVDYDSADYGLGTGWLYYLDAMCNNPATGAQWSVADINALDLGVLVD